MEQFPHKPKTRFRLLISVSVLLAGLWAAAWVTSLAMAPVLVRKAIPNLTAQEMRPGNTPNERAMDFLNNAIGRKLFAQGAALETLAQQVREHPDIIRHPDEVGTFGEQRLLR